MFLGSHGSGSFAVKSVRAGLNPGRYAMKTNVGSLNRFVRVILGLSTCPLPGSRV